MELPDRVSSSAAGQLFEFRIWSELIAQSRGALHVFLPLLDRGLDGVVHRLTDGAYLAIQCKSRAALRDSMLNIVVRADSLVDDSAWVVAGLNTLDSGLGPIVLAVPVAEFRKLAAIEHAAGFEWYQASFSMHPHASRWERWLVPREQLATVFLGGSVGVGWGFWTADLEVETVESLAPASRETGWVGYLGESEVIRRLAERAELDLFRPFPDLETVEVLCRDNRGATSRWCGLQVKTGVVASSPPRRVHVTFRRASFRPAASTYAVVLAWMPDAGAFHGECLLVPTEELGGVAAADGSALELVWEPRSPRRTVLDPYRVRLEELGSLVLGRCG